MSCGVGHIMPQISCCCGCGVALIRPLAWEHPYATGAALKTKQNKQTKKDREEKKRNLKEKLRHFKTN